VAERPVGARKPGNAGGAKGPQFKVDVTRGMTARRLAMSLVLQRRVERAVPQEPRKPREIVRAETGERYQRYITTDTFVDFDDRNPLK
jgi:hypothetical protein